LPSSRATTRKRRRISQSAISSSGAPPWPAASLKYALGRNYIKRLHAACAASIASQLPADWRNPEPPWKLREIGNDWLTRGEAAVLLAISALIGFFLGTVGIYGVLSYVVSQRTPEIGIRSALGASPGGVRRMVLAQGLRLAGVGVLIGLVAAVTLSRVMVAQLYGVSPLDPVTLVLASTVFLAVAAVASLLPAARAARTSPVDALRVG
jgi:ABC-type antimicrobial peptide transport system permease subunit